MTTPIDEIWTTADGRKLMVGEMEEAQMREALRQLIRRARLKQERRAAMLLKEAADKWGKT